jgi:urease gamma subunit
VALLATQLMEFIRDGRSVAELMDVGRRLLGSRQVMPGVAAELHEVSFNLDTKLPLPRKKRAHPGACLTETKKERKKNS